VSWIAFYGFTKIRLLTPLAVASVEDETISMTYKGVASCEIVRVTDAHATMEE
jgi:hypothetical protein